MPSRWTLWSAWTDALPESVREYAEGPVGIAVLAVAGLLVLFILYKVVGGMFGGGRGAVAAGSLKINLAELKPPAGTPGPHRLSVEGLPVWLVQVVLAPAGKDNPVDAREMEGLLDGVVRGLGALAREERPAVRVWPPQLSRQGFAPTFHRETEKAEPEGRPSRWVLVAGPANAGRKPFLLGLVLWADTPNTLGRVTLDVGRWAEVLRITANG